MNDYVIGTCSNCGGPVTRNFPTMSNPFPLPSCANCRAIPREPYGSTIDMQPSPIRKPEKEEVITDRNHPDYFNPIPRN